MTHEHRGHYAKKHLGAQRVPEIAEKLAAGAREGAIDCAAAHRIAKSAGFPVDQIGVQADLLELRIARCQLGLFGYGPEKKRLDPKVAVSDGLKADIIDTQEGGSLSCHRAWDLAKTHKISKMEMGSACEKLEIRIKPCQLGAF